MTVDPPPRIYLGSLRSWAERSRVYRTPEALEVDHIDHWEIRRRRVFFDEVLLVTLHQTRMAGPYPWLLGILAIIAALLSLGLSNAPGFRLGTFALAAVCGLAALGVGTSPVWMVTVFGRRTRARMKFRWREGKAREVYAEVCRAANEAQRRLAATRPAREEAPPPLPLTAAAEIPLPPAT